mmetsp:Transcript_22125/g.44375  ORF Transcript_22125/g.44375 Transcript_22125/m.44375 type:complete len:237 (+) Transcript_22125:241-951(+)|eukprot:CAMPEP_0194328624 /NCGR_PEP_ID=MMETSP0171-20130528/45515_1 /TAXON_ID=218684 /ORGANISM="Corethron pennatum, Strain L29A3" /LENGTH=236 /DNA_ID=CAMNT_0039089055 /DNA_START=225 /DNA_END=935 /DNA_ORIENTATION=+
MSSANDPDLLATPDMAAFCFDVLSAALGNHPEPPPPSPPLLSPSSSASSMASEAASDGGTPGHWSVSDTECPLFVTFEARRGGAAYALRGCIGTLSPRRLSDAVREYALAAALRDSRFRPISVEELPNLRVSVSLLVGYEECADWRDWEVGTHGIAIRFRVARREYSGTYLPDVAPQQGWTREQAVSSLVRKAGYSGAVTGRLLGSIACTRYQSSKATMTYGEYAAARSAGEKGCA